MFGIGARPPSRWRPAQTLGFAFRSDSEIKRQRLWFRCLCEFWRLAALRFEPQSTGRTTRPAVVRPCTPSFFRHGNGRPDREARSNVVRRIKPARFTPGLPSPAPPHAGTLRGLPSGEAPNVLASSLLTLLTINGPCGSCSMKSGYSLLPLRASCEGNPIRGYLEPSVVKKSP